MHIARVDSIRLRRGNVVHVNRAVTNLDFVTADRDHALYEAKAGVTWILKDDDLAALRFLQHRQPPASERNPGPVQPLVQKQMIAHQDGAFHRRRGHDARLDYESTDEKRCGGE